MRNKYRAIKSNGYDSRKENKRANELKLLVRGGVISDLQEQVKFELQEGFVDNQGKKIRPISYVADFAYYDEEKGVGVVEDVKGFKTPEYRIKCKLFKFKYPQFLFIES